MIRYKWSQLKYKLSLESEKIINLPMNQYAQESSDQDTSLKRMLMTHILQVIHPLLKNTKTPANLQAVLLEMQILPLLLH